MSQDLLGHLQLLYSVTIFTARKNHVIFYKLHEETIFVCLGLRAKHSLEEHMAVIWIFFSLFFQTLRNNFANSISILWSNKEMPVRHHYGLVTIREHNWTTFLLWKLKPLEISFWRVLVLTHLKLCPGLLRSLLIVFQTWRHPFMWFIWKVFSKPFWNFGWQNEKI